MAVKKQTHRKFTAREKREIRERRRELRAERRRELIESPLNPDWFYRITDGSKFFGFNPTQLTEKIDSGEIPTPVSLTDTGRARGWFGRQILAWQREREVKSGRQQTLA